jgi:hypothetical protein
MLQPGAIYPYAGAARPIRQRLFEDARLGESIPGDSV